jgi:hypothetical protein
LPVEDPVIFTGKLNDLIGVAFLLQSRYGLIDLSGCIHGLRTLYRPPEDPLKCGGTDGRRIKPGFYRMARSLNSRNSGHRHRHLPRTHCQLHQKALSQISIEFLPNNRRWLYNRLSPCGLRSIRVRKPSAQPSNHPDYGSLLVKMGHSLDLLMPGEMISDIQISVHLARREEKHL